MTFSNRICRQLEEEHAATVQLMDRLSQLLARHPRSTPPRGDDRAVGQFLADLASAIETDLARHFSFEERALFPYLDANGEAEIGAHLADEHAVIRPLGERLVALSRGAGAGFDEARWSEFRKVGQDLCDRLTGHAQKEDSALLPLLEDTMDAETEAKLYDEYVGNE